MVTQKGMPMATTKKENEAERKTDPTIAINYSHKLDPNHHQIQHPEYRIVSLKATPPRKEHCLSTIIAQYKL
jgi:hypothetical protein